MSLSLRSNILPSSTDLTWQTLWIDDSDLIDVRHKLYSSAGPGYFIFKNFLTLHQTQHLREIWTDPEACANFTAFKSKSDFVFGCPNFYSDINGEKVFYNFLWSAPLDELTYTTAFFIQMIRNRIEGKIPFNETVTSAQSVSFRVICNRNTTEWSKPHRDYHDEPNPRDKSSYDLLRVQATLNLSKYGTDYDGEGFTFTTTHGKELVMGKDVEINPGDLILWRYNNWHGIRNIQSRSNQIGFLRIIFPPEIIHAEFSFIRRFSITSHRLHSFAKHIRNKILGLKMKAIRND